MHLQLLLTAVESAVCDANLNVVYELHDEYNSCIINK